MKQKQLVLDHLEASGGFVNVEFDDRNEKVQHSVMTALEVISNLVVAWRVIFHQNYCSFIRRCDLWVAAFFFHFFVVGCVLVFFLLSGTSVPR
jgi:hypothetical protein